MRKIPFNTGWKFGYGDGSSGFFAVLGRRNDLVDVLLPHDFTISRDVTPDAPSKGDSGYYPGDAGTYEKVFTLDSIPDTVLVDFDGVYRDAHVRLGSTELAVHHYGYTPFTVDLTKYLKVGENKLVVTASNVPEGHSRWYAGGGIFREVNLLTAGKRYIAPRGGIFVRTESISKDGAASMAVDVTLAGEPIEGERVRFTVTSPEGEIVAKFCKPAIDGKVSTAFAIGNAKLWDLDHPNLYTLKCEVTVDGETIDESETQFGARVITIDAKNGFRLNGKQLILQGGCVHHDNGPIGAVSTPIVEERRVRKLKEGGYHAIRTAHNPPSAALLDACDKLGMLVLDEAFDMWLHGKNTYDYHKDFESCWEQDIEAMVLRDRSHPSVFMWSIGNEILDQWFGEAGIDRMKMLARKVRSLDPTRMVTMGGVFINKGTPEDNEEFGRWCEKHGLENEYANKRGDMGGFFSGIKKITKEETDEIEKELGIIDLHYDVQRYPSLCRERPNAIVLCSESFAKETALEWKIMREHPQIIGDFVWTAWDYIGEAGCGSVRYFSDEDIAKMGGMPERGTAFTVFPIGYPFRLAHDGDFDLLGYDRPLSHYRRAVWGSKETYVCAFPPCNNGKFEDISRWTWTDVKASWTFPGYEGEPTRVEIYSGAEEVELILNGKSLGRKPAGDKANYRTIFEVPYEPGELTAVGYENGKELSRMTLETAGEAKSIVLKPETDAVPACPKNFIYVNMEFVDEKGRRVPYVEKSATAKVEGEGTLAAFASSIAATEENYTTGSFTSRDGRLQAIIRSTGKPGVAKLTVSSEGFADATVEVRFN